MALQPAMLRSATPASPLRLTAKKVPASATHAARLSLRRGAQLRCAAAHLGRPRDRVPSRAESTRLSSRFALHMCTANGTATATRRQIQQARLPLLLLCSNSAIAIITIILKNIARLSDMVRVALAAEQLCTWHDRKLASDSPSSTDQALLSKSVSARRMAAAGPASGQRARAALSYIHGHETVLIIVWIGGARHKLR